MSECLIKAIYFDQHVVLDKKDYEIVKSDDPSEPSVILRYQNSILCRPFIYFRPTNISDTLSEYALTELIWECYEGHAYVVSQSIEESTDKLSITTRYGMLHEDENGHLSGNHFSYCQAHHKYDDNQVYEYEIENSIVPEDRSCTPLNPLGIKVEGTLTCSEVEIPLAGSFLC